MCSLQYISSPDSPDVKRAGPNTFSANPREFEDVLKSDGILLDPANVPCNPSNTVLETPGWEQRLSSVLQNLHDLCTLVKPHLQTYH